MDTEATRQNSSPEDSAGYDVAIDTLQGMLETAPEGDQADLATKIANLEAQREKAQVQATKSADAEDARAYRMLKVDEDIKEILPDIDPKTVRGNSRDERMANAEMLAEAIKPFQEKAKAEETDAPTDAQKAAHGRPMSPGGEIPEGHDSAENIGKGIDKGDLKQILDDPEYQKKINLAVEKAKGA